MVRQCTSNELDTGLRDALWHRDTIRQPVPPVRIVGYTHDDITTLITHNAKLNDTVIDAYRSILNNHPLYYFLNSYSQRIIRSTPPRDYAQQRIFVVPYFILESHWALVIFNLASFTIEYYDSLFELEQIPGLAEQLVQRMYQFIDEFKLVCNRPFGRTAPRIEDHQDVNIQTDDITCGVYVLYWMRMLYLTTRIDPEDTPTPDHMRSILHHDLVQGRVMS